MSLVLLQTISALAVAALALAASFLEFADYYLHGRRVGNPSALLSAAGLFLLTVSLAASETVLRALRVLAWPGPRFALFLAGSACLFASISIYLYLTYVRPARLRFEEESARLPRFPEPGGSEGAGGTEPTEPRAGGDDRGPSGA